MVAVRTTDPLGGGVAVRERLPAPVSSDGDGAGSGESGVIATHLGQTLVAALSLLELTVAS